MNIKFSGVVVGVVGALAATSAVASPRTDNGHFEWQPGIQAPGPRAPLATPHWVWVPAALAMTDASTCPHMMTAKSAVMACCASHTS